MQRTKFNKLIHQCDLAARAVLDSDSKLQLTDFLVMPIQRLPRYLLFLRVCYALYLCSHHITHTKL
jgi:hypothetical protein